MFIGGYGLLALALATRVVVCHGRYPFTDESRLLFSPLVVRGARAQSYVGLASTAGAAARRGTSAALWIVAWLAWSVGAMPRIAVVLGGPAPAPPPSR